ncbi:MAG: FAD-dependent oxidoreductase [Clostridia bacterium]|nr:FAD-dependent oxidoreductase [Clostridia bacterium]
MKAEKTAEIVIVGAGSSGICAAIAAARAGRKVLLTDRNQVLGGTNTLSMVSPLMGFSSGGREVVAGIAQEIVDRLAQRGGTLGHIPDPLGVTETITPIDTELLKQVYYELLRETEGIELLLNTSLVSSKVEEDRIISLQVLCKDGVREITGDIFIDASGDGDLAVASGVPYVLGRESDRLAQPMTEMFRIGGVDFTKVRSYMRSHPEQFVLAPDADSMPYTAVSGYFDTVAKAREKGDLTLARDRVLLFEGVRSDEAVVNMSRVILKSGTSSAEMTEAEIEGRRQIDEIIAFLRKYVDGFQNIRLLATGAAIGVRETRHIECRYCLNEQDVVAGSVFEDAVAVCAFPIDIHDPAGQELHWTKTDTLPCYDVPYGVMVPRKIRNLLVTGRCVCATHEAAASVRITPTAMALGQAAGVAAAIACSEERPVGEVDVHRLQRALLEAGAIPGKAFV